MLQGRQRRLASLMSGLEEGRRIAPVSAGRMGHGGKGILACPHALVQWTRAGALFVITKQHRSQTKLLTMHAPTALFVITKQHRSQTKLPSMHAPTMVGMLGSVVIIGACTWVS